MSQDGQETKEAEVCPWCGAELERGSYVSKVYGGFFLPEGESMPAHCTKKSMAKRRGVVPKSDFSLHSRCVEAEAFICRACKKIVIPYESKEKSDKQGT